MKALFIKYWWVVLVVIVVCVFGVQRCENNSLKDELQLKDVQLSALNDSVTFHKGKNGDLISIIRADVVEKDNLKQALLDAGLSSAAELRKNDIKWRNLTEALKIKYEASNHGTMTLHDTLWNTKTDTIHGQIGKWNDCYLFLNQTIQPGSSAVTYFYQTGIQLYTTQDGKNNLVQARLTDPIDPKIKNPYGKITIGNALIIKPVSRWWDKWYVYGAAGLIGGYFVAK